MPDGGTKAPLSGWTASVSQQFQQTGLFSPGAPLIPVNPQEPRRWDFPVGQNLQFRPRAYEPFSFASIRAFSNTELIRLAIETRKDQIERLEWQIKSRRKRKPRHDNDERIRVIERFLAKPDGITPFSTWIRMLIDDVLTIDAPCLECRRTRAGKLTGLDIVDGSTIKLLINNEGRRPVYPAPAYQQVIKGTIWNDLTDRDLLYLPRNVRPGHIYGFSPVEQTIVTINIALRRQTSQLAYFTDGNIPAGLLTVPEGWTVDQIKEYAAWFDGRMSGNLAERSKIVIGPNGSQYQPFKEPPLKDEFDEWLARIVCYAFSLPPTPFVRTMNRATALQADVSSLEEGLAPLKVWAKRLVDHVIHEEFGFPDLEFMWMPDVELDPTKQEVIWDTALRNGSMTLDEVRAARGMDAYPGGIGNVARIYTPTGTIVIGEEPTPEELAALNQPQPAPSNKAGAKKE